MSQRSFLPVCLNITGKKILFIGGGKTASHKLKALIRYTRNITILAEKISPEIRAKGLTLLEKSYESGDLEGFFLVYACTNNKTLDRKIKDDGEAQGLLVNITDTADLSHFTSPAIFKKDNMSIAVSSNAEDVRKAISWRKKIKGVFEND